MRDHSHHIELSREQAVAAMLEHWDARSASAGKSEVVPIAQAYGRVLAADVFSRVDMPNALTCCMDSIAVHWSDFESGEMPDTSTWTRGIDWQFANTGVAMPAGFDAAIVIEHVTVSADEQQVQISAAPSRRFAGTKPIGDNLREGEKLASAGDVVTPDVAARIASGNHCSVEVASKPRVAFIPTGNELVCPGGSIEAGKNLETNSVVVRGKIEAWGGIPLVFDIVPDIPERIEEAVRKAVAMADIVVLNAGSSKGSDDWSVEELEKMGTVLCHETNHGPGHHSSYAIVEGKPIVGISGPAGGASFTLNFYLRPLIRAFLGLEPEIPRILARLAAPFPAKKSAHDAPTQVAGETRPDIVAPEATFFGIKFVMLELGADGVVQATPLPGRPGSKETLGANAYYMMPSGPGITPPCVGDVIEVELR